MIIAPRALWGHRLLVAAKFACSGGLAAAAGARWVPGDVLSVIFIALICTRPAVSSALRDAREQVLASLLGCAVAVLVFAAIGHGPPGVALAAALVWALEARLGWGFNAFVIMLLSVAYLGYPSDAPWTERILLRETSLLLGVAVALAVNVLAAPWLGPLNLRVRLAEGMQRVQRFMETLATDLQQANPSTLGRTATLFDREYALLVELRGELADLSRDVRVAPLLPGATAASAAEVVQVAFELEQVVHHLQDATGAARSVIAGLEAASPPEDFLLLGTCVETLRAGATALAEVASGRSAQGGELARAEVRRLRELDARIAAPEEIDERLGPRLWIMLSLAAALGHILRVAQRAESWASGEAPTQVALARSQAGEQAS